MAHCIGSGVLAGSKTEGETKIETASLLALALARMGLLGGVWVSSSPSPLDRWCLDTPWYSTVELFSHLPLTVGQNAHLGWSPSRLIQPTHRRVSETPIVLLRASPTSEPANS